MKKKIVVVLSILFLAGTTAYSQSDNRSFLSLLKAANKGDSQAQALAAYRLKDGVGVKKDWAAAKKWAQIASQNRNGLGYWLLAQMSHEAGDSLSAYRKHLESAMSCNYPLALSYFARLYETGSPDFDIEKDEFMAFELYREAAEYGDMESATRVGYLYLVTRNDPLSAIEYLGKAVAKGDGEAMSMLASIYFNGVGTAKDHDKAVELFRKAAEAGSPYGAACYGKIQSSSIENLNMPIQECLEAFSQRPVSSPESILSQVTFEYPVPKDVIVLDTEELEEEDDDVVVDDAQSVPQVSTPVQRPPKVSKEKPVRSSSATPGRNLFLMKVGASIIPMRAGATFIPVNVGLGIYDILGSPIGVALEGFRFSTDTPFGERPTLFYGYDASLVIRAAKGFYPKAGAGLFVWNTDNVKGITGLYASLGLTFLIKKHFYLEIGAKYFPEIQENSIKRIPTANTYYDFPVTSVNFGGFTPTLGIGWAF